MYNRNELESMAHGRVKKLAIAKARQNGHKRSWVQTTPKSQLIDYILGGELPKEETQVPTPQPTPLPHTPRPASTEQTTVGGLEEIIVNGVLTKVQPFIEEGIGNAVKETEDTLISTFHEETNKLAEKVDKKIEGLQRPIKVYINDVETKEVSGLKHEKFAEVLECLKLFGRVWTFGPSGTGKSFLIEQCAKALGFDKEEGTYEYLKGSAGVTESHMTGRMTFDGTFIDGSVARAFRNGTFLCLDEFDGFDANAGLVFNSVLDNQGVLSTPNDKDNPHVLKKDGFNVAVASNTLCDGQDFEYVGRGQIDGATLDRLQAVKVYIDYDKNIERALSGDFIDMAECLWELRNRIQKNHLKRIISTRLFVDGQTWRLAGKSNKVLLDKITCGWTKEELDKINYTELKREYK